VIVSQTRFRRRAGATARAAWLALVLAALAGAPLEAQTDYYNTDRGRPNQVEDAYATERYAFELKLSSVRLERARGGVYNWGVEPEIAYGILPRTHVEIGLPLTYREVGAQRQSGVAGLELSVMHNLNAETEGLPALGVRADLLAPVGNLAPSSAYYSITGIGTRTWSWARIHMNAQYTGGAAVDGVASADDAGAAELSRWMVGGAVDKTFPLRSSLVSAELFARQPLIPEEDVELTVGIGARHQFTTAVALDAGIGRRLNGEAAGWYVTFGSAYAFGLPILFPTNR
jgi:hypothetical protein